MKSEQYQNKEQTQHTYTFVAVNQKFPKRINQKKRAEYRRSATKTTKEMGEKTSVPEKCALQRVRKGKEDAGMKMKEVESVVIYINIGKWLVRK